MAFNLLLITGVSGLRLLLLLSGNEEVFSVAASIHFLTVSECREIPSDCSRSCMLAPTVFSWSVETLCCPTALSPAADVILALPAVLVLCDCPAISGTPTLVAEVLVETPGFVPAADRFGLAEEDFAAGLPGPLLTYF